jgi:hypothetical protein
MNRERLELLSTMLGEVIAGQWRITRISGDLAYWGQDLKIERNGTLDFKMRTWLGYRDCGFSACAIGHACLDERFNQLGFMFCGDNPLFSVSERVEHFGWTAVTKFFEIDQQIADWLFSMYAYFEPGVTWSGDDSVPQASPQQVKERIDDLLETDEEQFRTTIPEYANE